MTSAGRGIVGRPHQSNPIKAHTHMCALVGVASKAFDVLEGVRQMCVMPPLIFNTVIDGIVVK